MTTGIQTTKETSAELWFDELIATLRTHQLQLVTDTASQELKDVYKVLMSENLDELFKVNKAHSQQYFVRQVILEYLRLLENNLPKKLAFDFNDSEVLVWAEIENNDEVQEKALARAESKINAKFHPFGFDMESLIVEAGDNMQIPNHYKIYKA